MSSFVIDSTDHESGRLWMFRAYKWCARSAAYRTIKLVASGVKTHNTGRIARITSGRATDCLSTPWVAFSVMGLAVLRDGVHDTPQNRRAGVLARYAIGSPN